MRVWSNRWLDKSNTARPQTVICQRLSGMMVTFNYLLPHFPDGRLPRFDGYWPWLFQNSCIITGASISSSCTHVEAHDKLKSYPLHFEGLTPKIYSKSHASFDTGVFAWGVDRVREGSSFPVWLQLLVLLSLLALGSLLSVVSKYMSVSISLSISQVLSVNS